MNFSTLEFFIYFSADTFFAITCLAHNLKWLLIITYTYAQISIEETLARSRAVLLKILFVCGVIWQISFLLISALLTNLKSGREGESQLSYQLFMWNIVVTYALLAASFGLLVSWFTRRIPNLLPFFYKNIRMRLYIISFAFLLVLVARELFYVLDYLVWVGGIQSAHRTDTILAFINYYVELLLNFVLITGMHNSDRFLV